MSEYILYTDGGSRGNPGISGCGIVIKKPDGKIVAGKGFFIGEKTNNEAEYEGLLRGLIELKKLEADNIKICCDSELLVKQINGQYRVKSENLIPIYQKCIELLKDFSSWKIAHIYRDQNAKADELANMAMDKKADVSEKKVAAEPVGRKIRLGILVSGGGRTMMNIHQEIQAGRLNAEIAVVICSRQQIKGVELAKKNGFKTEIVRRKDFDTIENFSDKITDIISDAKVDLVIQAGWLCLWLIPKELTNKVMNIHPSLLPSFGGGGMWGHFVHEAVIKRGCKISGCTVHFCNNEYDKGPIIIQRSCPVMETDDADILAERVFGQECIAYPEAIRLFSQSKLKVDGQIVRRV